MIDIGQAWIQLAYREKGDMTLSVGGEVHCREQEPDPSSHNHRSALPVVRQTTGARSR